MTVSEIGVLRLKNLIEGDEGLKKRELYVIEKEITKVLGEYFSLNSKSIKFNFCKNNGGNICINIAAVADDVKNFRVL